LFLTVAAVGRAQEPLRWKFQPGLRLRYEIVQEFSASAEPAADGLTNQSRQQLDVSWEISQVDDDGTARVNLKFDRIRTKMTLPIGGLDYDSASDGPAIGMAAINAPLYQALTKTPVHLQLAADGRVTSVGLSEDTQAVLKRMPTSEAIGDFTRPERFQTLFLTGFPQLPPEKSPTPGDKWQAKSSAPLPGGETQTVESNYTYDGLREVNGTSLAVIRLLRTVSIGNGNSPTRSIKEQASESEFLFDTAAGRLHSSMLKHHMTIAVKERGIAGVQKVEQSIQVKLVEAGD
jgi:hypothetical protein